MRLCRCVAIDRKRPLTIAVSGLALMMDLVALPQLNRAIAGDLPEIQMCSPFPFSHRLLTQVRSSYQFTSISSTYVQVLYQPSARLKTAM